MPAHNAFVIQTFVFVILTSLTFGTTDDAMESERIYRNLGLRIRDLRKGLGQTQEQLAKQVGISRASLANIEAGRQQLLVHHLFALAAALDLDSPAALLLPPPAKSQRSRSLELPLTGEGLTEKQRREVLSLMGDALNNTTEKAGRKHP